MAEQKGLKEDEVIARLVPDPAVPADVIRMTGYLGKSVRRGYWRLYRTLELNNYLEIAEDDIVHSQSLASQEDSSRGGTLLWVRRDAILHHTRTESRQAQAELLKGDITGGFLSDSGVLDTQGALRLEMRGTRKCLTWGCCRFDRLSEETSEARRGFLEGDIVGLFLREALASEEGAIMTSRTHRVFTLGCCPTGPITRDIAI